MNRLDEHRRLDILEEIAEDAVLQEFKYIVVAVVNRQHDDLGLGLRRLELARHLKPRQPRHIEVEEQHVGLQNEGSGERLLPILRLADDLQVVFEIQHAFNPLPKQRMVVRDQDLDCHCQTSFPFRLIPPFLRQEKKYRARCARSKIS